jgi:hypothetical protein
MADAKLLLQETQHATLFWDPPGRPMLPVTCVLLKVDSAQRITRKLMNLSTTWMRGLRVKYAELAWSVLILSWHLLFKGCAHQFTPVKGSAGTVPPAAGTAGPATAGGVAARAGKAAD